MILFDDHFSTMDPRLPESYIIEALFYEIQFNHEIAAKSNLTG